MANNYTQSSSFLPIGQDKIGRAQAIIDRVIREIESDEEGDGFCCCQVEVEVDGVWFHEDESVNPEHVAEIARALVDELEIDAPFFCSWAYTCSKPRIDEFGGGAFVIKRGCKTYWVDAMSAVEEAVKDGILVREEA